MRNLLSKCSSRMGYILGMGSLWIAMYFYDKPIKEYHMENYIFFIFCAILMSLLFVGRGVQTGITKGAMIVLTLSIWFTTFQSEIPHVHNFFMNIVFLLISSNHFVSLYTLFETHSLATFPIALWILLLIFMVVPKGYFSLNSVTGISRLLFQDKKEE